MKHMHKSLHDYNEKRHNRLRDEIYHRPSLIHLDKELLVSRAREYDIFRHNTLIGSVDILFKLFDYSLFIEVKGTNSSKTKHKGVDQCMKYLDWANDNGYKQSESWLVYPHRSVGKIIRPEGLVIKAYNNNGDEIDVCGNLEAHIHNEDERRLMQGIV